MFTKAIRRLLFSIYNNPHKCSYRILFDHMLTAIIIDNDKTIVAMQLSEFQGNKIQNTS